MRGREEKWQAGEVDWMRRMKMKLGIKEKRKEKGEEEGFMERKVHIHYIL
jgi:hypothetical protein